GRDLYYRDLNAETRKVVFDLLGRPEILIWIVCSAAGLAAIRYMARKDLITTREVSTLMSYLIGTLILLTVYIWQFIFYSGEYYSGISRYMFQGILARDFALFLAAVIAAKIVAVGSKRPRLGIVTT